MSNNNGHEQPAHNDNNESKPDAAYIEQLEKLVSTSPEIQPLAANQKPRHIPKFEEPVILKQPRIWSRGILWSLMLATTGAFVWANFASIDEAISATGKLEASGTTKEVQAPVGGVVKEIYVEDGKQVKAGERLLSLDNTTVKAQLESLKKVRTSLVEENQFYQSQLRGTAVDVTKLQISSQMLDLTKSRGSLLAENQFLRAQADGFQNNNLNVTQKERLLSSQAELQARVDSEIEQFKKQLQQTEIRLVATKRNLKTTQGMLKDITPLVESGAFPKIQYKKQEQDVVSAQSEVDQLEQERGRLQSEISQAQSQLKNTVAVSRRDWLNQIAANNQRIAEIDSQLTKAIVENNKKIAEIDSQISQATMNLKYQEITAPAAGTIFELKAKYPGFVVNNSAPILKIVPNDKLVAQVFVTNKDIGFVNKGMDVDVRIDSFPFSEFGDIKGEVVFIGSDALPPDQIYPFYRFPVTIELKSQQLSARGKNLELQSGMSISANIKTRDDKKVIDIFIDKFSRIFDSFQNTR
jgi:hemolysin D